MTLAPPPSSHRVVLHGVSWSLYQQMLAEVGDGHLRLTYDRGSLEIMSPSDLHEKVKTVTARLIEAYADAVDIVVEGLGSTTFLREDALRGLEPDECYYVAHAAAVIGKTELDLTIDPPPDLAIEVDISPPSVQRQPIYATLGVPEIWRYDGRRLTSLHRTEQGEYIAAERSLSFPDLPMDELNRFIQIGLTSGQSAAVRALRDWLKGRRRRRTGRRSKP